jgi:acyl-CoA oxidase
VSELLGGKLKLPTCQNALTLLAQQEQGLMNDIQSRLTEVGGYRQHRSQAFNQHVLPLCRPLVEAIGHRMAYEAAQQAGISSDVLELYERLSASKPLIYLSAQSMGKARCGDPLLDEQYESTLAQIRSESLHRDPVDDYITAPIVSEEKWNDFTNGLFCFVQPSGGKYNSKL